MVEREQVAVVGGGVAGLTAAYVLRQRYDVTLYEADQRLGGHAHTHDVVDTRGALQRVDTGFLVHNRRTYPTLLRLFGELGVATQASEMSMSVRCEGCGLEYAGARGPRGLFAQPRRAADPRFLRMLAEVPVFHRRARALLAAPAEAPEPTVGEFARQHGFSAYFVAHFLTPVVSAVWSCPGEVALAYPARYLFRFLQHHGMLSVTGSPTWRTVTGGSQEYVRRIAKQLHRVRTGAPVTRVVRHQGTGVEVEDATGAVLPYRAVVLALHPHRSLAVLDEPTEAEREVLGAFRYSRNPALLHGDTSVLPRSGAARASWNHLLPACDADAGAVQVSYDLNRLQRLDTTDRYLVTLNAGTLVDPATVLDRMDYEHPVYTRESVAAQARLPDLGTAVCAFAGAWHGWGFHEDGCRSGVAAAAALGVSW
ncbi:NAD(P)/FAD-dependent oxidoreductase [Streptacidiphilus jiangxiensis]|uniref:Predicted NAD/FAD-binding protein n=1 Tax=Streptacidiphilus jiangxiensis TaxID=235985 RepID=A0A1H7N4I1_STRJI|nr:FAD-dependent oxidoreductase [Streptacidiphilus jiangxiensis]SEL17855.1 Predicted NAD/FAD-binding protein [Streptacidiphilus jiangxiensis]